MTNEPENNAPTATPPQTIAAGSVGSSAWPDEATAALADARRLAQRLARLDMPHAANSMHAVSAMLIVRIEERSPSSIVRISDDAT